MACHWVAATRKSHAWRISFSPTSPNRSFACDRHTGTLEYLRALWSFPPPAATALKGRPAFCLSRLLSVASPSPLPPLPLPLPLSPPSRLFYFHFFFRYFYYAIFSDPIPPRPFNSSPSTTTRTIAKDNNNTTSTTFFRSRGAPPERDRATSSSCLQTTSTPKTTPTRFFSSSPRMLRRYALGFSNVGRQFSTMGSTTPMEDAIRAKLTAALNPLTLEIYNDSHLHAHHKAMAGTTSKETHFRLVITSEAFASKMQPARHRMVYALLTEEMAQEGGIHALQLRTMTPEEEQRQKKKKEAEAAAKAEAQQERLKQRDAEKEADSAAAAATAASATTANESPKKA